MISSTNTICKGFRHQKEEISRTAIAPVPDSHHVYHIKILFIPLPLSLTLFISANAKLWKAAMIKRFEMQHLDRKDLNSVGTISLILAMLKNVSFPSVATEKVKHTQGFRQPHAVSRREGTSAWSTYLSPSLQRTLDYWNAIAKVVHRAEGRSKHYCSQGSQPLDTLSLCYLPASHKSGKTLFSLKILCFLFLSKIKHVQPHSAFIN